MIDLLDLYLKANLAKTKSDAYLLDFQVSHINPEDRTAVEKQQMALMNAHPDFKDVFNANKTLKHLLESLAFVLSHDVDATALSGIVDKTIFSPIHEARGTIERIVGDS